MMNNYKQKPLVSIVIAAYNCEKYFDECMESLLNQTYKNIEFVVCDDCSSDNTYDILKKYKNLNNFTLIRNDTNRRQAYSRNRCIGLCHGDYIMIQDADDVAAPERVAKLLDAFEDGIDFVGSGFYLFDDNGPYKNSAKQVPYPSKRDFLFGVPFLHASIMFKSEVFKSSCYDEKYKRAEDYSMLMDVYSKGFKGKNIDDILYGYRVDKTTIARRDLKSRFEECSVRYHGYKKNHMLFPTGWIYIAKPVIGYFVQIIKN